MRNPEHLLMMGYHRNLMTFGRILEKVARQGETVPPDVARAAVAEMRRSVDEIEKHRPMAMRGMPAEMQQGEMQKMMDQHLVDVKSHLRQLEDLSKSDRIPSQEVLKHTEAIFAGCQKMGCGRGAMHGKGMHCGGMQGAKERGDCSCDQHCMGTGPGGCADHPMAMGPVGGHPGMQDMVQRMKRQDTELQSQVRKMQQARKDKKVDLMAGIVAQLVQQRAELTSHMEKMQTHMMHRQSGEPQECCEGTAAVPPPPPGARLFKNGAGPDEEGEGDLDSDDVEVDEVVGY